MRCYRLRCFQSIGAYRKITPSISSPSWMTPVGSACWRYPATIPEQYLCILPSKSLWAGATIPVHDRHTGEVWQAPLFVATLGASSYTWAEATRDMQMETWLRAHVHAFEHCSGIPALAPKRP